MANLAEASTLTAAQMAFFSEDELVSIIPSEPLPELDLISGTIGPFIPAEEVQVPLWLAARFRQKGQCIIVPPKWLTVEYMERVNNAQGRPLTPEETAQTQLPYHWREMANTLLSVAEEDIAQAAAVSNLLDHLWTKRANEMRNNLIVLAGTEDFVFVEITNLQVGSMELNTVRPFFLETTSQLYKLGALASTVNQGSDTDTNRQNDDYPSLSQRPRDIDGAPFAKQSRYDSQSQF